MDFSQHLCKTLPYFVIFSRLLKKTFIMQVSHLCHEDFMRQVVKFPGTFFVEDRIYHGGGRRKQINAWYLNTHTWFIYNLNRVQVINNIHSGYHYYTYTIANVIQLSVIPLHIQYIYIYTWRVSPCFAPLCFPFVSPSTYLAPSSCDRNRPPRSQVACKLTPFAHPSPNCPTPSKFPEPQLPSALQRRPREYSGSCYPEHSIQHLFYLIYDLYVNSIEINVSGI